MTVGEIGKGELWEMMVGSAGFLTIEQPGDDGVQVVVALVPIPRHADPARCRAIADWLARGISAALEQAGSGDPAEGKGLGDGGP